MKKLYFVLLLALLVGAHNAAFAASPIWNGTVNTVWYTGAPAGTTVFNISTAEQLAGLAQLVNDGNRFTGRIIRLTQNIVLNDIANWHNWGTTPPTRHWTPIGRFFITFPGVRNYRPFEGTFDGQGFSVIGVYINSTYRDRGLFGFAENGIIRNVGVTHSFIRGGGATGGLVGWGLGVTVENSFNSGTVQGTGYGVGGLVGVGDRGFVLQRSFNTGAVSGATDVGGLVGVLRGNNSRVANSFNTGAVSGTDMVGGLVGLGHDNFSVTNSYNTGAVTRISGTSERIGSLVGETRLPGTVTTSFFLAGTAARGIGLGAAAGTSQTLVQFRSGEVAHLLQGTQPTLIWGHTVLGGTELPLLRHFTPTARQVRRVSFASTTPAHNSIGFFLNGNPVVFPALVRPGFGVEWRDAANNVFTAASLVTADLTLTAHWIDQITFNSNGGTPVAPITQNFGTAITAPAPPTRAGFIFAGWSPAFPATMPAGGAILTAQWANIDWFSDAPAGTTVFDIYTAEQLVGLRHLVNTGEQNFSGMTVRLMNNIVLNDIANWQNWSGTVQPTNHWTPIGTVITGTPNIERPFRGTFDGQGFEVQGVYIYQPALDIQGLFGFISNATIQTTGVVSSFVRGRYQVGGIVGWSNGTITNSFNTGTVRGNTQVGGIVGWSDGSITGSHNTGAVSGTGENGTTGGIVGRNNGSITNSYSTGQVTGTGRNGNTGGIVGVNIGSITNSYSTGWVSMENAPYGNTGGLAGINHGTINGGFFNGRVLGLRKPLEIHGTGGIAGYNSLTGTITNSSTGEHNVFSANHVVLGGNNVGGIVGLNEGTIANSSNNLQVESITEGRSVGGIVGMNINPGSITNSYNTAGAIAAYRVGQIVGANIGSITNSYSTGWALANTGTYGLEGEQMRGSITNSFFLAGSATRGVGGTPKTPEQFRSGEVAHLLQGAQADPIWGHTVLGGTELPRLLHFTPAALQVRRVDFTSDNPVHNSFRFFLRGDNLIFPVLDRPGFRAVWRNAYNIEFTAASPVMADLALTAHWVHDVTSIEPGIREEGFGVALFPNPVRHNLVVRITGAGEHVGRQATLVVYDLKGRKFLSETIMIHGAHQERTLDVSQLPAGAAILVLDIEGVGIKRAVFLKSER